MVLERAGDGERGVDARADGERAVAGEQDAERRAERVDRDGRQRRRARCRPRGGAHRADPK